MRTTKETFIDLFLAKRKFNAYDIQVENVCYVGTKCAVMYQRKKHTHTHIPDTA